MEKKEYEVEYQETKPIKETILILIVHSEHALLVHWQNQLHLNTSVDVAYGSGNQIGCICLRGL